MDISVEHDTKSHFTLEYTKQLHSFGNISLLQVEALFVLFFLESSGASFWRVIGIQDSVLRIHAPLVTACKYAAIANVGQPLLLDLFSIHFRRFTTRRMFCFGLFLTLIRFCCHFIVVLKRNNELWKLTYVLSLTEFKVAYFYTENLGNIFLQGYIILYCCF